MALDRLLEERDCGIDTHGACRRLCAQLETPPTVVRQRCLVERKRPFRELAGSLPGRKPKSGGRCMLEPACRGCPQHLARAAVDRGHERGGPLEGGGVVTADDLGERARCDRQAREPVRQAAMKCRPLGP